MWRIEFSAEAVRDFELILDHLLSAYVEFGDEPEEAVRRAADRIRHLRTEIDRLIETPHIGTARSDIYPGIRFLRRDKAAIWFSPVDDTQTIRVAAILFGGQDHIRHMLARLLEARQ